MDVKGKHCRSGRSRYCFRFGFSKPRLPKFFFLPSYSFKPCDHLPAGCRQFLVRCGAPSQNSSICRSICTIHPNIGFSNQQASFET